MILRDTRDTQPALGADEGTSEQHELVPLPDPTPLASSTHVVDATSRCVGFDESGVECDYCCHFKLYCPGVPMAPKRLACDNELQQVGEEQEANETREFEAFTMRMQERDNRMADVAPSFESMRAAAQARRSDRPDLEPPPSLPPSGPGAQIS